MSPGLLAVVDLGSFTLLGLGLGFVLLWVIDRSHVHALLFAAMILFYFASNWVLSFSIDVAMASSIHGILVPIGFLFLADGLLRRSGDRLGRPAAIAAVVVPAAAVWYFAYATPMVGGRIVTQSLFLGSLLLLTTARVWIMCRRRPSDLLIVIATLMLSTALFANVVLTLFSDLPRDLSTDAAVDQFARSPVAVGIAIAGAMILPMAMAAFLAAITVDMVADLRFERDRDDLTGLLNRRGFTERAEGTLRKSDSAALILADLDFFKEVNDELGHAGGDFALKTFAEVLESAPDIGQVAGRIGGEEFAVLAPNAGSREAFVFAECIRTRLAAKTISYGSAEASLTASFGVATARTPVSLAELMEAADRALYEAKAMGRNCTALRRPR